MVKGSTTQALPLSCIAMVVWSQRVLTSAVQAAIADAAKFCSTPSFFGGFAVVSAMVPMVAKQEGAVHLFSFFSRSD